MSRLRIRRFYGTRRFEVGPKTIDHRISILAVDAFARSTGDLSFTFVVPGLDTFPNLLVVHYVRLEIHDGSAVDAVGQKVPCPDVSALTHATGAAPGVFVGRQRSRLRERRANLF